MSSNASQRKAGAQPPPVGEVVRLLLADDQAGEGDPVRSLLAAASGLVAVSEAPDSEAAMVLARQWRPHVSLVHLDLPPAGGVALARSLRELEPGMVVLMLVAAERRQERGPELGAAVAESITGVLVKSAELAELARLLQRLAQPAPAAPPEKAGEVAEGVKGGQTVPGPRRRPRRGAALTAREEEVLGLLALGASNREIGKALGISEHTARAHLRSIMAKLALRSRAQAAALAARRAAERPPPQPNHGGLPGRSDQDATG